VTPVLSRSVLSWSRLPGVSGWRAGWLRLGRRRRELIPLAAWLVLTLLIGIGAVLVSPMVFPPAALVLPALLGGWTLATRRLAYLYLALLAMLILDVSALGWRTTRPGGIVAVVVVAAGAWLLATSRQRVGLSTARGGSMLIELRDRLAAGGELPPLERPWHAEVVQRWAGGASFGGDFLVSRRSPDGRLFEIVLVDVSGKGADAGARALVLSGALGGLLGALPADEFLPAANAFLLRQGWSEGFATAVHLRLNLTTGDYRIAAAGHLPAAHYAGGSGRWRLAGARGTVLGVVPDLRLTPETGRLRPHDALLLYTDGLVERPGRDIAVGIDRLLGEAERMIPRGFAGGAARLVDSAGAHSSDDRALVLLWRT
jgi:hypothetical protein